MSKGGSGRSAFGSGYATTPVDIKDFNCVAETNPAELRRHIPVWRKGGYDREMNQVIICTPMYLDMWLRDDTTHCDAKGEKIVRNYLAETQQSLYEAASEPIVLVYCHMFLTSLHWLVTELLQDTWKTLLGTYGENVRRVYVLQGNLWLRMKTCFLSSPDVSIVHVKNIEEVLDACVDEQDEAAFVRHIPLAIRRLDTERQGGEYPRIFGARLHDVCEWHGLDEFVYKQVFYRLPPTVFALTHELTHTSHLNDLDKMWTNAATEAYKVVKGLDAGMMPPFPSSLTRSALWMALKLWFDCLPVPLFSFEAYHELQLRKVRCEFPRDHLIFIHSLFNGNSLDHFAITVALFLARFLHSFASQAKDPNLIAQKLASIFAPCYFRPRVLINPDAIKVANAVIATLILEAHRFCPPDRSADNNPMRLGETITVDDILKNFESPRAM